MSSAVIPVQVRTVIPTSAGRAVFLGNDDKTFVIYVDDGVGAAITMFLHGAQKERPLTHDLMGHLMRALGAKIEWVIVNDLKRSVYHARLIISAENELQQRKIIELDARPSDCLALAVSQGAPIYVTRDVWEEVDDVSDALRSLEQGQVPEPGEGEEEEE